MNTATRLYDKFAAAGMTDAAIRGVLCNLWAESLLRSNNVEDRSGIPDDVYTAMVDAGGYDFATDNGKHYGFGLAQWTYPTRKTNLLIFAKARNVSISDEDMQGDFLLKELREDFPGLFAILRTTTSVLDATNLFMRQFENPDGNPARIVFLPQIEQLLAEDPQEPAYWPPRILERGMKGPDVAAMQSVLAARGYDVTIDGDFGAKTEEAVIAFKTGEGLSKPGVMGKKAWSRLLRR